MPTYCYKTEDGIVVERVFRMGEAPRTVQTEEGKTATRDYASEHKSAPTSAGWPLECVASGVHPDQAGELRQYFKRHGVPTEVSKDGNPIYRDANHRKRALKARGLFDRTAFC